MNPQDIRALLRKTGRTLSDVGRDAGARSQTVGQVVDGKGRSKRIEEHIAEITGLPLFELWPQWYEAPKGHTKPAIGSAGVDPVVLAFVLYAIEDELQKRLPALAKPYEVALLHVGRVYNSLTVRTQDAPEFAQSLRDAVRAYVDTFDYEGGPDLLGVFMRKGTTGLQPLKSGTVITSTAPNAKIAGRDFIEGKGSRR